MSASLNFLGGAARHSSQFAIFNHWPEIKPWARAGARPSDAAAAIIKLYMGEAFPVESVDGAILAAIETFAHRGAEDGLACYLEAIGRRGRVVLAAIKRNFTRYPERWAALGAL